MQYVRSNNRISWKPIFVLVRPLLLSLAIICSFGTLTASAKDDKVVMRYFSVTGCSSCKEARGILDTLKGRKGIKIYEYNTIEQKNQNLLEQYFSIYGVNKDNQKVPVIFVGDRYFSGKDQIKQELIPYLESGDIPATKDPKQTGSDDLIMNRFSSLKVLGVAAVGIMNGLTPCTISMLLLFISLLLVKNVNILKMGISYCTGKFITYFLMGTIFYRLIQVVNIDCFTAVLKYVIMCFIVIFAFFNIQDYFIAKKESYDKIKLQLPKSLRHWNHKWIGKINKLEDPRILIAFSFGLGVLTSVGEFLCTGQIYLTTILYMVHNQHVFSVQALTYFLIYNIGFITPLLIITAVINKGMILFDVSEVIRKKMPLIKLIYSIIFVVIGVMTLIW